MTSVCCIPLFLHPYLLHTQCILSFLLDIAIVIMVILCHPLGTRDTSLDPFFLSFFHFILYNFIIIVAGLFTLFSLSLSLSSFNFLTCSVDVIQYYLATFSIFYNFRENFKLNSIFIILLFSM